MLVILASVTEGWRDDTFGQFSQNGAKILSVSFSKITKKHLGGFQEVAACVICCLAGPCCYFSGSWLLKMHFSEKDMTTSKSKFGDFQWYESVHKFSTNGRRSLGEIATKRSQIHLSKMALVVVVGSKKGKGVTLLLIDFGDLRENSKCLFFKSQKTSFSRCPASAKALRRARMVIKARAVQMLMWSDGPR